MKKLVLLLVLVFVLTVSMGASAGDFELVGGITQNIISIKSTNLMVPAATAGSTTIGNVYSGYGYYGGARYWFSPKLAAGVGYDCWGGNFFIKEELGSEWYKNTDYLKLNGYYGELVYRLNKMFNISGALYSYNCVWGGLEQDSSGNSDDTILDETTGYGYGVKGEFNYPLFKSLSLLASAGYKSANFDELDGAKAKVYGFTGSLGLSFGF